MSSVAELFISKCFRDDQPISISPFFGESYLIKEKMCKFTESILEEMIQSGLVKVLSQGKKNVNLVGIKQF